MTIKNARSASSAGLRGPVAFVLPGGGSLGAVQVGMFHALTDAGIRPDVIVGTSAGALNGAIIATDPAQATARLRAMWTTLRRRDVIAVDPRQMLLGALARRESLFTDRRLREFIARHLPLHNIEDATVPFIATATDVDTGEHIAIASGDAASAVAASAALPGIFPPVQREGRMLIDGGVAAGWPVRHAVDAGARTVFVLQTATVQTMARRRGAFAMIERGIDLVAERAMEYERSAVDPSIVVHELVPPVSRASVFDLSSTRGLIDAAYVSARAAIERIDHGLGVRPMINNGPSWAKRVERSDTGSPLAITIH